MERMRQEFWNHKILKWEEARYANPRQWRSSAVAHRLEAAAHFLNTQPAGLRVLDLGCGSGQLFTHLDAPRFCGLHGIDISGVAIEAARARHLAGPAKFEVGDVCRAPWPAADLVVALGLLDWLTTDELNSLFEKLGGRSFLLSFSNKNKSSGVALHRLYVQLLYGWKSGAYRPRYHTPQELAELAGRHGHSKIFFYEHPQLGIGGLVSNWAFDSLPHA